MAVSEDFVSLTDPFRPELLAHCYRMLGSVHDAEDQVQETMIRAWRSYGEFEDQIHEPADPQDRALLDRFATAFQNADVTAVMQLLREDAVFEMPQEVTWFTGRELIGRFLQARILTLPGRFQMIPVAANGQPALAAYMRGRDGGYHAHSICVLTIAASRVTRVTSFNDPGLFAPFGLPQTVPAAAGPVPGR